MWRSSNAGRNVSIILCCFHFNLLVTQSSAVRRSPFAFRFPPLAFAKMSVPSHLLDQTFKNEGGEHLAPMPIDSVFPGVILKYTTRIWHSQDSRKGPGAGDWRSDKAAPSLWGSAARNRDVGNVEEDPYSQFVSGRCRWLCSQRSLNCVSLRIRTWRDDNVNTVKL